MLQQELSHRHLHNSKDNQCSNRAPNHNQDKLNRISVSTSRRAITHIKNIKHIRGPLVSSPTTQMREMTMTIMGRRNHTPQDSPISTRQRLSKFTISLRKLNTPRLRLMRRESSSTLIMNDIFERLQSNQVIKCVQFTS
jgi:hypothetical protein